MEKKGEFFFAFGHCAHCIILLTEAINVAQQVLALDTRYNACRSLPRQNRELTSGNFSSGVLEPAAFCRYAILTETESVAAGERDARRERSFRQKALPSPEGSAPGGQVRTPRQEVGIVSCLADDERFVCHCSRSSRSTGSMRGSGRRVSQSCLLAVV